MSHYVRVSDRVCYLDFNIPLKGGGSRKFRVVNCYGLTQFRANEKRAGGPRKVKNFYSELSGVCNVPRKWELYVIGDFNSKLGLRTNHDVKDGLSSHIGAYGMGTRNLNGESLLQFIVNYDLAACNTFFEHPCRHRKLPTKARVRQGSPNTVSQPLSIPRLTLFFVDVGLYV